MHFRLTRNQRLRLVDVDLASVTANQKQLCAARKKFWSAAFISLNVGLLVTNNAMKRLAKLRQRERICGSPIENQISVAIGFEKIPD